jgi:hypothetical protein
MIATRCFPRKASQRNSRRAAPITVRITPSWRTGDKVRWHGRAAVFRRDLGDGEHAEVAIGERVYRVWLREPVCAPPVALFCPGGRKPGTPFSAYSAPGRPLAAILSGNNPAGRADVAAVWPTISMLSGRPSNNIANGRSSSGGRWKRRPTLRCAGC